MDDNNRVVVGNDETGGTGVVINSLGTNQETGIAMSGTGTATGMSLAGTVGGASATMALSGTRATLQASTGMGLDVNTATADTTALSGGSGTDTASTVALADNRAEIMTADSGWGRNGMMANATTTTLVGGGTSMALSSSGAAFSECQRPVRLRFPAWLTVAAVTMRSTMVSCRMLKDWPLAVSQR